MFSDVLETLVSRVEEARGAAMVGTDGIAIAGHSCGADVDLERVAAECTSLIKSATATGRALEIGEARELVLRCEGAQTLLRSVTPECFLALILTPGAALGRARYELQKACQKIETELF